MLISPPTSSNGAGGSGSDDEDRGLSFEQIHKKYEAKIYNLIFRLVGNHDDAEELAVETFLNAWKAWDRFRGDARVSTWLHQIALNNCKNRFKQNDRRKGREVMSLDEHVETDSGDAIGREVADWRYVPERALLEGEFSRQLHKAIEALAPEYREVLVLAEMEDMSYEEIAEVLNLTIPAVKTRLHRARQKIKQRLEPYYRGWGAGGGAPGSGSAVGSSNTGADPSVKRNSNIGGGGDSVVRRPRSDAASRSSRENRNS